MSDEFEPPERGVIFWPVGTGDSTTVVVDDERWIQIDLHQLAASETDDDERVPVVDRLLELAPQRDSRPYIAAFTATHLDKDHILGFAKLNDEALIGELWFTPRVFWDAEDLKDLCDDAKAFVEEVDRRIEVLTTTGSAESGDRIKIFGDDDILGEAPYSDLPDECFTAVSEFFTVVDGEDLADVLRVFVLAPEKCDGSEERNDTSLGLQVLLVDGDARGTLVTLGDLAYPDVKAIFERENDEDVLWSVFQAPHHCSKAVMYWKDDGDESESLRQDVLDVIAGAADDDAWIIASCDIIPAKDEPGANPPHRVAATHYEELVEADHFLVTGDHAPDPLVFELGESGLCLRNADVVEASARSGKSIPAATAAASGSSSTGHSSAVGFGS